VLEDNLGVPQVYWSGQFNNQYTVMVMDCLGKSIEDQLSFCKRKFTLKTVLLIAD
jgi:hypothetical protein